MLSLSASSLLVSPQLTGVSEQMRLIELVPPFSTFRVGAWANSSHFSRVCSQVPERGRPGAGLPSAAPSYPPPSAAPASSPRTCVLLLSGHPFLPLSTPLPTQGSRRWWQRRLEGGPEGWDQARAAALFPEAGGSGVPPSGLALWLSLQHPRRRHHEQSEQLPCQRGSRAPVHACPEPTPASEPTPAPESTPASDPTPAPEPTPEPPPEPSPVPAPSPVAAGKTHLVYPEVNPNPLLHSNFCSLLFLR